VSQQKKTSEKCRQGMVENEEDKEMGSNTDSKKTTFNSQKHKNLWDQRNDRKPPHNRRIEQKWASTIVFELERPVRTEL